MVNTWSFTLLLCFFQCSIFAEPVRYVIQEWSKESSGKLVLTCSDRCRDNFTCSVLWYLNQRIISDAINLTIDSGSEYGEYICTRSSDNAVLKKVLLIPPGNNFTCANCLTFSVCRSGHEIYFYFMLNIDEQAVEVIKCDLIKNGLFPECQFGFQTCSFNVTSFDFSAYYMAQCPLINSSSNYHIDSVAKQIGLAEDLEICTTMVPVTSTAIVSSSQATVTTIITPAITPSPANDDNDESFGTGATVGTIMGVLVLFLVLTVVSVIIGCCYCRKRSPNPRVSNRSSCTTHTSNKAFQVTDVPLSSIKLEENGTTVGATISNGHPLMASASNPQAQGVEDIHTDQLRLCDDSELEELIRRAHDVIQRHIDFATLMQYFNKHDVFSSDDKYQFTHNSPTAGVNYLIEQITKKGKGDARKFILALHDGTEHTGHKEILKALKVTVRGDQVYHYSSELHSY